MENKPLVSICCITFNHEKFIRDCLNGFFIQETNFSYEILIHDDASTDGTVAIIKEYEEKYPDIIKPIYQKENQYSKGHKINIYFNFPRARGKYISICDGDDYWIDSSKLQKQVEFLERNVEFSICGSDAKFVNNLNNEISFNKALKFGVINISDIIENNQFITCTVMFKKENFTKIGQRIINFKYFSVDYAIWMNLLLDSKGYNLNNITAVYNIHNQGVASSRNLNKILNDKIKDRILYIENFPFKKYLFKKSGIKYYLYFIRESLLFKKGYIESVVSNFILFLKLIFK